MADLVSDSGSLAPESWPISTLLPAFIIFTGKQLQGVKGFTNQFLKHSMVDREMMMVLCCTLGVPFKAASSPAPSAS